MAQAQKLASDGGGADWDRRNRLKVYRGLSRLLERDIKGAATLLIDCIATFSCNEICSYQSFIVYAILSNLLHIPRPEMKEKLLEGPEVLSIATDIPEVVSHTFFSMRGGIVSEFFSNFFWFYPRWRLSNRYTTATTRPT